MRIMRFNESTESSKDIKSGIKDILVEFNDIEFNIFIRTYIPTGHSYEIFEVSLTSKKNHDISILELLLDADNKIKSLYDLTHFKKFRINSASGYNKEGLEINLYYSKEKDNRTFLIKQGDKEDFESYLQDVLKLEYDSSYSDEWWNIADGLRIDYLNDEDDGDTFYLSYDYGFDEDYSEETLEYISKYEGEYFEFDDDGLNMIIKLLDLIKKDKKSS